MSNIDACWRQALGPCGRAGHFAGPSSGCFASRLTRKALCWMRPLPQGSQCMACQARACPELRRTAKPSRRARCTSAYEPQLCRSLDVRRAGTAPWPLPLPRLGLRPGAPSGQVFAVCKGGGCRGPLALPRLLEGRAAARNWKAPPLPPPGPCAVGMDKMRAKAEVLPEEQATCVKHIDDAFREPECAYRRCAWQFLSQKLQMESLFGAQVRSVPMDLDADLNPKAAGPQAHAAYALKHYEACLQLGGSYFGTAFMSEDLVGYELGACAPQSCPTKVVEWWTAEVMYQWQPGLRIVPNTFQVTELAHISEVNLQWVIAGVVRSGTTSLAAWLSRHPDLELLVHPEDSCLEGGLDYLFRRTYMEHLLPRSELPKISSKRLRGVKDTTLMKWARGRRVLGELKQVKVLIIVKDWVEWFKSASNSSRESLAQQIGNSSSNPMPFHHAEIGQQLQDAQRFGLEPGRVHVVHLDTLRASRGPLNLAVWLGARELNTTKMKQSFPSENSWHSLTWQAAWWQELCELPGPLMQKLEARRHAATRDVPALLRRSGESVPPSAISPRPIRAIACRQARLAKSSSKNRAGDLHGMEPSDRL
ncbi:unnamed protein product [Effrenium voratum]|nr:unnamed protein product [Effrenium voratum]